MADDRRHHRRNPYGSAKKARVAMLMLVSIAAIDGRRAERAIRLQDRVCAMIWRLMESRR